MMEERTRKRDDRELHDASHRSRKKRQRRMKANRPVRLDENGEVVEVDPRNTQWYFKYVLSPDVNNGNFLKKFRRRFRLPYNCFKDLVEKCERSGYFDRWMSADAIGRPSSPLELMVLGSLRYLGRGLMFDDLEDYTSIDEETHRQFFHVFIDYGSKELFQEFVVTPANAAQAATHIHLSHSIVCLIDSGCEKISLSLSLETTLKY